MVASKVTRQAMWFSSLFESIGVLQMKPIVIYDDNQSCILLLKNTIFHAHIKTYWDSSLVGAREDWKKFC
jgi:hypothetical protein